MRKLTDREKLEQIFMNADEYDAPKFLDLAAVIVRARFPEHKPPAKRTRRKLKEPESPLLAVSK